ncbi:MAG TPA: AmmeMemoRadiSam system radical SAM enzyme [Candidatus Saccharimonadales bacterium]|nr:AmmeMemoRadiSam system radical SAM enzyme [Candidatus Saccharimonadales bacterium]
MPALAPETPARYWHTLDDGRVQCDLCPRHCRLRDGQRGFCFVRRREGAGLLAPYARCSGLCADPVEKKPLYHFLPGSAVLSFGTLGCNLACRCCQNWHLSRSRDAQRSLEAAAPDAVVRAALAAGCAGVAFTYNDPVVFHEYAVDTARACRRAGLRTVAVTAGYVCPEPRAEFYREMDAANVDLKAFTERHYREMSGVSLEPVLDTLRYIRRETRTWLELTTLLIPGENDTDAELEELTRWVVEELGPDVPMHFTAFHPAWRMADHPPTPRATLTRARRVAMRAGVRYAYTGNVHDPEGSATRCHACGRILILREGFSAAVTGLDGAGRCRGCGTPCAGVF